jgi:putative FmdB family regulatory protein
MPIYEYRCRKCGSAFEMLRPLGDTGKDLKCPECGAPRPGKVFSTFAAGSSGASGEIGSCPAVSSCEAGSRYG